MAKSRRPINQPTGKKRGFKALAVLILTASSLATNGFGVFPDNALSKAFREVAGENLPSELLSPVNQYFELISAPTIEPVAPESTDTPPDPIGFIINFLFQSPPQQAVESVSPLDSLMTEVAGSQTALAQTMTALPIFTQTPTTTSTFTPLPPTSTVTASPSATLTPEIFQQLWFPPKVVKEEPEPPTFTPTATPIPYLIFYQGGFTDGAILNRANADAFCTAGLPAGYANYRAVISMNLTDSVANMPANYGIPTGTQIRNDTGIQLIGNNWADLLDGSIITSLQAAGVISTEWWSGSFGDGTNDAANDCGDWTNSGLGFPAGSSGSITLTTSQWISWNTPNCANVNPILCVAY